MHLAIRNAFYYFDNNKQDAKKFYKAFCDAYSKVKMKMDGPVSFYIGQDITELAGSERIKKIFELLRNPRGVYGISIAILSISEPLLKKWCIENDFPEEGDVANALEIPAHIACWLSTSMVAGCKLRDYTPIFADGKASGEVLFFPDND